MNLAELLAILLAIPNPGDTKVMLDGHSLLRVIPRFLISVVDLVSFDEDPRAKESEAIIRKAENG